MRAARRAACALAVLLGFCGAVGAWMRPDVDCRINPAARHAISVGDVVFFRTTTWRGKIVRLLQFDTDDYAHAGVVVGNVPDLLVAHACPTEPATVRIESLHELLMRDEITAFAVYRPRAGQTEAVRAGRIAADYAHRATPFDFDFNLGDDREVYCTELVWLAYRSSGLTIEATDRILFPAELLHTRFFEEVRPGGRAPCLPRG